MVGLISIVILIPLAGAIALYIGQPKNTRTVALIFNALSAFYAAMLWQKFDVTASGLQIVERHAWIPSIGAEYLVGVDGLSLLLVLLTSLGIYFAEGTFDFAALAGLGKGGLLGGKLQWLAFTGIFLGLAVKVPLFPFHTWLPDAYQTAPTGVSMVLTGALSKMGVYGFIRLLVPLFPNEIKIAGPWLLALVVCSIVFAPLAAWAQRDLKRTVAYLSINHLGYCLLGLFAITARSTSSLIDTHAALSGVFLQIFNHGITAAALFYFVGLLEQRRGRRGIDDFGGLMQRTPLLCGWMSVAMFSSLGLPGLNGFIGEFLIFKGSFEIGRAHV